MSTLLETKPLESEVSMTTFDNVYCINHYRKKYNSSDYYISQQGNTLIYYKKETKPYQYDLKINNLIIDTYSDSIIEEDI